MSKKFETGVGLKACLTHDTRNAISRSDSISLFRRYLLCTIVFLSKVEHLKMNLKNFGYKAIDYDIKNEFNETDVIIDLFKEIEKAYKKEKSIFDNITKKDIILAFFPCVRFEDQIQMHFRGTCASLKKWNNEQKLEYDLKLHKELNLMYETITKLAIVCIKKNIPLIIENPYSTTHYLTKYWAIPSKIIDKNRTLHGDYYEKPTQYWFINCEPKNNMILEAYS